MRTKWTGLLMLGVSLGLFACSAKTIVRPVNGVKLERQGVFYALPRTYVTVEVPVVRTEATAGTYWRWSEHLLGVPPDVRGADVPAGKKNEGKHYSIRKATLDTLGVPDPNAVYMVEIKGRYFEEKTLDLELTEDSILSAFEAESSNRAVEVILAGASQVGAIVGKFLNPLSGLPTDTPQAALPDGKYRLKWGIGADEPPQEAREAADLIRDLTAKRDTLLGGGVPPGTPPETLQMILEKLEQRIKELSEKHFLGRRSMAVWNALGGLDPDENDALSSQVLFKLDAQEGACDPPAELYVPANFVAKSPHQCQEVKLTVKKQMAGTVSGQVDKVKKVNEKENGFYYRIPGPATVTVNFGDQLKGDALLQVAQYGTIVALPPGSGGRRTKYDLDLHAGSGALKNFALGSDGLLQANNIQSAGGVASGLIDSIQARQAARMQQPPDELAILQREASILEVRQQIRDLLRALNMEDNGGGN